MFSVRWELNIHDGRTLDSSSGYGTVLEELPGSIFNTKAEVAYSSATSVTTETT